MSFPRTALFIAFSCTCLTAFQTQPGLELIKQTAAGEVKISAKNVSGEPITAYVVAVRSADGSRSQTVRGRYTGRDAMTPGDTIDIGSYKESESSSLRVFVDYVQLANGRAWGDCVTDECKELKSLK